MSYPANVNISIEALPESVIQEITYDGQEIYQLPFTLSENLSRLIRKIDFTKPLSDVVKQESKLTDIVEEIPESAHLPWTALCNKIRNAVTEICVLTDVLNVAKEKHFMVLDPVPQESFESKPIAQIYSRKKGLAQAASMLISAAERLRSTQSEINRNKTTPDFHIELLRLRQNWRLKKVSNAIIGDLSYRTAGSKFQPTGMFEVSKADKNANVENSHPTSPGTNTNIGVVPVKPPTALCVTVPTELQGVAYIMVLCQKDKENLFRTNVSLLGSSPNTSNLDMHWQQKLEAAQNVLFCKELFSLLAKEAVYLQGAIPHLVIGNQIMATVLPGIQLTIGLCHSSRNDKKQTNNIPYKSNHDHVLEHSLHQLLREVHHKNTHHPFPHPSSGPLGPTKKRYLAGPNASSRAELIAMVKNPTLLEQIIEQARQFFMRIKAEYVLDSISKRLKDPLIISHWNTLNSPTPACARITIISNGFDTIWRTSLLLQVLQNSYKCICKDGRVMNLTYEAQELEDLILYQVYNHQIVGVQSIAKSMGWQLLTSTPHLGVGPAQPYANAASSIFSSPLGDRLIAVKWEPHNRMQVSIAHSPRKDFFSGQLVKERKWENLGGPFKEVRWDKMEGKNFLNKMELLMSSLMSPS